MTLGSEKTGQVQARRGASSVRSLFGSTALMHAGRVAFFSFAISGAIATTSAFADGGGSGGVVGAPDSIHSAGSDGASIGLGGGGGGAGTSGGMGGMDSSGHQAAGGDTTGHTSKDGEDGADVSVGTGAGGGGGGAHGFVGDLPAAAATGGAGGNGGNGLAGGSFGGGGGAGGWGAIITTAAGWAGTLTFDVTGGKGGNGGLGLGAGANSGSGGTGGTGLFVANRGDLTIDAAVTGGKGGDGGWRGGLPIPKLPGTGGDGLSMNGGGTVTVAKNGSVAGGDGGGVGGIGVAGFGGNGIIGADLTVINEGTISAGRSDDPSLQSHAIYFSGGTNVLELRGGATVNGIVSENGADGTLRLGGTTSGSFDASTLDINGQYQGFEHFEKTGSSIWTLTGTSTFIGGMDINGGTLVVNGDLSSAGLILVNPGGTLSGTGTVPFTAVDDGATLAPGPVNGIGVLTVKDGVLFCNCSTYAVKVSGTGSDRANVVAGGSSPGDALLDGKVRVTSPTGSYRFNSAYTILSAQGGLNGTTFDTLETQTGIGGVLSYTSNDVLLTLTSQLGQVTGLNGNQQRVATTLDNAINTSGSINGLGGIFGSNIAQNLTQASGELGTASQQTTFQAMNLFMGLITDPFSAGRGVNGADANNTTGFAEDSESMAYTGRARSKNPRDAFAAFTKAPPAVFAQRWNVWTAGYGGSQTTDGNAVVGSNNTTSAVYGGVAGADYWFSPDTVAGFALAGGGSNFSVANGGTGRSDLFQAGAFVRHNFDATYLIAAVAYGWQDVTTDRNVSIAGVDHLRANFNANAYSGRLELGHRFLTPWFGGLGVSPYAAAQITAFELPSYSERAVSGASTFALNYGADTATSSRTELGLRSDKSYALDGAVLTLRGRAAWAHDFNPDRAISATFQTLPGASFVVNGAALASDTALTTASAELRWLTGWSIAATFEGEFSDVTRSYAGKGVVRYNW